jgi:hypothetical protein
VRRIFRCSPASLTHAEARGSGAAGSRAERRRHPNRATLDTIASSPLDVEQVRHGEVPKAPKIERPMIIGAARLPTAG